MTQTQAQELAEELLANTRKWADLTEEELRAAHPLIKESKDPRANVARRRHDEEFF